MSSRAELVAAVNAQPEGSRPWRDAFLALAAFVRAQRLAAPAKPGRPTGLTPAELFTRLTSSHVFDADRTSLRQQFLYGSPSKRSLLIEWAKTEVSARKKAEKQAAAATC